MMTPSFASMVLLFVLVCFASLVQGGLKPQRTYYGVGRAIPMTIEDVQDGAEVSIKLHEPGGEVVAEASAAAGGVDLNGLFPMLWRQESEDVLYAQAYVAGEASGPPVVLQAMVTPDYAATTRGRTPMFQSELLRERAAQGQAVPPRPVTYSGIRAYVDRRVVLDTTAGEIELRLRPDAAPNTAWRFRGLVEGGFYTEIIFHRVVAQLDSGHPFVIQVGDPTGSGSGGNGELLDLENSDLPHDFGVVSMARSSDPNSGGSQFFICLSRDGTSFLDGGYTAFGEAVRGAGVIQEIAATPVGPRDRPLDPPVIKSAWLVDAAPMTNRPPRVTRPEDGPVER